MVQMCEFQVLAALLGEDTCSVCFVIQHMSWWWQEPRPHKRARTSSCSIKLKCFLFKYIRRRGLYMAGKVIWTCILKLVDDTGLGVAGHVSGVMKYCNLFEV